MSIMNSQHPLFGDFVIEARKMRDCLSEESVKQKSTTYLPASASHIADGMAFGQVGYTNYESYKLRAVFPEYVKDAADRYQGLLHQKPPSFELPAKMQSLLLNATDSGETLEQVYRRITMEQLVPGRVGIMFDIDMDEKKLPVPKLVIHMAENVQNWDAENGFINFLIIDESGKTRNGFQWDDLKEYRVCWVDENGLYSTAIVREDSGAENPEQLADIINPKIFNSTLDKVPFVFINSKDVLANPDTPPLQSLARICLAIYRSEADYRQSLYMQGQDTLVVINGVGGDEKTRVGAGAKIDVDSGGDAKFIGVDSSGLSEQRKALESDREYARFKAGHLVTVNNKDGESGTALKIRTGTQIASLNDIAKTAAAGLEFILKIGAEWMGLNPDEVKVIPNLEFTDVEIDGQNLVQIQTAKTMGFPLSQQSLHNLAVEKGLTKLTFEEELAAIDEEITVPPVNNQTGSLNG